MGPTNPAVQAFDGWLAHAALVCLGVVVVVVALIVAAVVLWHWLGRLEERRLMRQERARILRADDWRKGLEREMMEGAALGFRPWIQWTTSYFTDEEADADGSRLRSMGYVSTADQRRHQDGVLIERVITWAIDWPRFNEALARFRQMEAREQVTA